MPSREWRTRPTLAPDPALVEAVGGRTLLARLLTQRGFASPATARAFLDPAEYQPSAITEMPGVVMAAEILRNAIDAGQRLLVWGDFDVDGQTSTTLLVTMLRWLAGEDRVRYHVPLRADGHGVQVERLQAILDDFPADLILTCDTGIAEAEGVHYARGAGLTVLVTDHHELPASLRAALARGEPLWGLSLAESPEPDVRLANAIVNPHFLADDHPLAALPGVGVAWLLAKQLLRLFGRATEAQPLLELVALGIVADVARQVDDTRYLLQLCLEELRHTQRQGLLALMEFASLDPKTATSESIGYQIGPRLNAVGRLDDAAQAIQLLTVTDPIEARILAARVDRLNRERRILTSEAVAEALERIEHQPHLLDAGVLIVESPTWPTGIIGLVAGRLVEEFRKPVIVVRAPPGEVARGSARSTPGVHIGAAIAACGDLLLGHGGHAGAAGFSLRPENLNAFRRRLEQRVGQFRIEGSDEAEALTIDAELTLDEATLATAEVVTRLAPFGLGNPPPIFLSSNLAILDDRRFGQDGTHRRLTLRDADNVEAELTWFNGADAELPVGAVDVAYTVGVNEYRGSRTVQLQTVAVRRSPVQALPDSAPKHTGPLTVIDLRHARDPLDQVPDPSRWYAEGVRLHETARPDYAPRQALSGAQGGALVLWSAPPSAALLDWIMQNARPDALYLVGIPASTDTVDGLLSAVVSMCKYAIQRDQPADLGRMAARAGVTEAIIRTALLLLAQGGVIRLGEWLAGDRVRITAGAAAVGAATVSAAPAGSPEREPDVRELSTRLREELAEVRAYRRFFQTSRLDLLSLPATVAAS